MHEHTVRVATASGVVEGFARDGVNRWRSIPYARPPVGRLRFRAPQPVSPWSGVRYCHSFGACAPQHRSYTMTGLGKYQRMSEDCLTLNVVTPRWAGPVPDHEPLPVMVFIHGGGFERGSKRQVDRQTLRDLLAAGVRIFEYVGGLLHTKSLTLDGEVTLIGSANMDRRSFELNYENNILFYDPVLTADMRQRQQEYIARSRPVALNEVTAWPMRRRLWNNAIAMLGPVL